MMDEYYMNIALQLAESVQGQTSPNPPVGTVIVKNGAIIGVGAHLKSGQDHAEVIALKMAGKAAENATMYVTLEPCSHTGKTPPCVERIIQAKLQRVVIASIDQHHQVAGKGINRLRVANIAVEENVLVERANELYEQFFHYINDKLPYVTLKTAMTLDGKTATESGDSKWITGEQAREDVHRYRHLHDAILVGVGTVLADDPHLTTRLQHGRNPVRIILDTHLRTPQNANVVTDGQSPTWIFVSNSVAKERIIPFTAYEQVEIVQLPEAEIDVHEVLHYLGQHEITSLFVEGGASVHGSFLKAGYIQTFLCYIAPKIIGGQHAKTPIGGEGMTKIAEALNLNIKSIEKLGNDMKVIATKEDN